MTEQTAQTLVALFIGAFWTGFLAIFGVTGNPLILTFFGLTIIMKLGFNRIHTHGWNVK